VQKQLSAAQEQIGSMNKELLFLRGRVTELEAKLAAGGGEDGQREQALLSHIREVRRTAPLSAGSRWR
jgi:hypothetical protein